MKNGLRDPRKQGGQLRGSTTGPGQGDHWTSVMRVETEQRRDPDDSGGEIGSTGRLQGI